MRGCEWVTILETVQNKSLRQVTGAFSTTPIRAMEIEASIPPIAHHLDYANRRAAIRFLRLPHPSDLGSPPATSPPHEPPNLQSPPFSIPHRNYRNRNNYDAETLVNRKKTECTNIW
jgi:hypothetical protein